MKTKRLFFVLAFSAISISSLSQGKEKKPQPSYKTAIGGKFFPLGVSIKSMAGKKKAFEFLGYFREGFRITGLFEYHGIISQEQNFKWYIGGGGHIGFADKDHGGDAKLGVDGVIGLDYKFLNLPLNLSVDWQPSLGIGDDDTFSAGWGGIGVRYCF